MVVEASLVQSITPIIPLALFSYGVRAVKLSRLGFMQYYSPSLNLLIGVFVFREPFTPAHLAGFGLIWTAILIVLSGSLAAPEGGRPPKRIPAQRENQG